MCTVLWLVKREVSQSLSGPPRSTRWTRCAILPATFTHSTHGLSRPRPEQGSGIQLIFGSKMESPDASMFFQQPEWSRRPTNFSAKDFVRLLVVLSDRSSAGVDSRMAA